MAQLASSFKNMLVVLTTISLFAALTLGSVYQLTKGPIEASKIAKQENAIKDVLPPYTRLDEAVQVKLDGMADDFIVYKAYQEDEFVGAAVQTYSNNAFSGQIKIMVGFDKKGNIVNYTVLEQKETPGLGTKMVEWFKTNKAAQSIIGLNGATNNLTVSKDGGEVDAITASTISSRAFLEAVRYAYTAYANNQDANTTATKITNETSASEDAKNGGE